VNASSHASRVSALQVGMLCRVIWIGQLSLFEAYGDQVGYVGSIRLRFKRRRRRRWLLARKARACQLL
jgi:hypothetical protein